MTYFRRFLRAPNTITGSDALCSMRSGMLKVLHITSAHQRCACSSASERFPVHWNYCGHVLHSTLLSWSKGSVWSTVPWLHPFPSATGILALKGLLANKGPARFQESQSERMIHSSVVSSKSLRVGGPGYF